MQCTHPSRSEPCARAFFSAPVATGPSLHLASQVHFIVWTISGAWSSGERIWYDARGLELADLHLLLGPEAVQGAVAVAHGADEAAEREGRVLASVHTRVVQVANVHLRSTQRQTLSGVTWCFPDMRGFVAVPR